MKHSNFILTIELMPGTSVADAVQEAKTLAQTLNIAYVNFRFNDINFSVGQRAVVEEAEEALTEAYKATRNKLVILN